MLAIRLQRVGRTGHAMYRIAVQEAQRHPSSGRIIAYVGTYDPHTKAANVQVEIAQKYLDTGAQPSPRVIKLLSDAGVKLPKWVEKSLSKSKVIRHSEKLRKNRSEVAEVKKPKEVIETAEPEEITETTESAEVAEPEVVVESAPQE
ncbi:MAG TPA: 30S ribosomal protein S16 [Candidatus Angelobacter sp.]|nr:30S ribosomal protein S16 [Candidatus Angelobacter sp.]